MFKQKIKCHIAEIFQLIKGGKTVRFLPYILKSLNRSVYHTLNTLLNKFLFISKMIIHKT